MKKQRGERYSKAERQAIWDEHKASGLSINTWCKQQGYNKGTLRRWLADAGKKQLTQDSQTSSGFVALQVESRLATGRLQIQYPSGVSVSIEGP